MNDNINYSFKGKIYKTSSTAKAAQTRYRNKKLKALREEDQTETIKNKIKTIEDKILKEKQEKKVKQKEQLKLKKVLEKLPKYIETETTQNNKFLIISLKYNTKYTTSEICVRAVWLAPSKNRCVRYIKGNLPKHLTVRRL